ncbi:MAG: riboflavin biosynthesis protein RibF [Eubacterium sp.]|nr:riboflavin biosynthesis protein RibF [Eubacterium sp.]
MELKTPFPTRIAFGFFDGLHTGHRAVIERLSGHEAVIPAVLSFSAEGSPFLYSEKEKACLLRRAGVERMFSIPYEQIRELTGEELVRDVLAGKLQAGEIVAGENLCFGRDHRDADALRTYGKKYGFQTEIVPAVKEGGEPVSANLVRNAAADGDFERMKILLGHAYLLQGTIVHGKAAGRRHDMPTANLAVHPNKILPPFGVYATVSHIDGAFFYGITNIGRRPSDDNDPSVTIETKLNHFCYDIYGKEVTLEIHAWLRGIQRFPGGLDEVREQLQKDMKNMEKYFQTPERNEW